MKRALFSLVIMFSIIVLALVTASCQNSHKTNDAAERDEDGRYLTIINDTNQVINKVYVFVGEGTEIDSMEQTNPDATSFSIEIPDAYSEYTTFTVVMVDRYELHYGKDVTDVPATGRTEVKISESNYIEKEGDFWKKLDKWMNGD